MATAEELLGTISDVTDNFLVVDLDTRIISIPTSVKILGVESDDDVRHLRFKVPRNYGEYDLSTFSIQVNFKNAKGSGDFYLVNDLTVTDDGNMTFTWIVDRHAFEREGEVDFSLCMKKFDGEGVIIKELNTAIATLPVLKGLETTKAVVENNASAFDSVLFRLYAIEAATGNSQNGYYTVVSVENTDEGVELSIFGADGTTVATVKHGRDGVDGYSPVKGVDYWTDEDQAEIKSYVDAWTPKVRTIALTASSWHDNLQTVAVDGVDMNTAVIVAPSPAKANREMYSECNVCCIEKNTNSLTFECESVPGGNLLVNVSIFYTSQVAE